MIEAIQRRSIGGGILLLPVRLVLHLVLKFLVLLFLGIRFLLRARLVKEGLLLVVVVGIAVWLAMGRPMLATTSAVPTEAGNGIIVGAGTQFPQAPSVSRYLTAQVSFDARGMWDNLSDQLKQRTFGPRGTVQQLQNELDGARDKGRRYTSATYAGGMALEDGRSVFFYVLTLNTPNASVQVPHTYIIGTDGKILNIE